MVENYSRNTVNYRRIPFLHSNETHKTNSNSLFINFTKFYPSLSENSLFQVKLMFSNNLLLSYLLSMKCTSRSRQKTQNLKCKVFYMISMLVIMDSIYILKGNLQKEKKDTDRNGIFLKVKVVGSNPGYQKLEKNIS